MSKLTKISLALSCFLPLFFIFGAENFSAAVCAFSTTKDMTVWDNVTNQSCYFYFNASLCVVWPVLFLAGICGIVHFHRTFLKAKKLSKTSVFLVKAENITADYYFTYFSLFVISFFGVDPTKYKDISIFCVLMVLIIWVYVANDMFFVNPVLNILGYKSFQITYVKSISPDIEKENEQQTSEIRVFSKDSLNRMTGEKLFITFSPHDFSVCCPPSIKHKD